MKNTEYHEECIKLIEKMCRNKFLMPDSHSEDAFLPSGLKYKTYVDSSSRNYANIYIKKADDTEEYTITLRNRSIRIDSYNIFKNPVTVKKVYEQILEIYNLKFSFAESDEWRTAIMEKISQKAIALRNAEKELKKQQDILKDFDSLNQQ